MKGDNGCIIRCLYKADLCMALIWVHAYLHLTIQPPNCCYFASTCMNKFQVDKRVMTYNVTDSSLIPSTV